MLGKSGTNLSSEEVAEAPYQVSRQAGKVLLRSCSISLNQSLSP